MQAYRYRVTIQADHRLSLELPAEVPVGEVEVIVLANPQPERSPAEALERLAAFREWLKTLPPTRTPPLSAFDRGDIYE